MDAKTKANFINSVAGGQKIPCPNCNTLNAPDSRFCISCGTKLNQPETAEKPAEENPKLFCPNCGIENEGDSLFCISCGTKIGGNPEISDKVDEGPAEDIEGGMAQMPEEELEKTEILNDAESEESGIVEEKDTPTSNTAPAFAPIRRPSGGNGASQPASPVVADAEKKPAFAKAIPEVPAYEEEESVFAKGLPSWDIVPPQVMVRRKRK